MAEDINIAIAEWARLLDEGSYFEAHEVLEGRWLCADEPEKTFLKGLIHVAVALHHHQRGNKHGARVKYQSAQRYLEPYRPIYRGIDLASLIDQLQPYFETLLTPAPGDAPAPSPAVIHVPRNFPGNKLPN